MRIYEIGTGYTPIPARMGAATEIVVEELTHSLRKCGQNATIIDIAANDRQQTDLPITEVPVPERFRGTDVQLGLMHKLKRVVYSLSLAKQLKKLLRNVGGEERIVLHFHNQYNLYFFSKLVPERLRNRAFIAYTNHSYIWHGAWEDIESTVKKRYFQEVACMRYADKVFVLNEPARMNIVAHVGIPEDKVVLIDNGVNTHVYEPIGPGEKEEGKRKYGAEGKTLFIQVGSVCDRKNQLGAVQLLKPLMEQNKQIIYLYAGGIIDPEYQKAICSFAKENHLEDQVRYVGELKPGRDLNQFYNIAEAMVFPSKAEGFSLVILEAMAAGVPVLISNQLEFKLASACLRYTDQTECLHRVTEQLLDPEIQRSLSQEARTAVVENYSWDKIAMEYLEQFK